MVPWTRTAIASLALGRLGFGVGLLARPEGVGAGWLGADAERPPVKIILRGLGARDIALSAGTLAALHDEDGLVPWLAAAVAADLSDVAATLIASPGELPGNARWGTVVLGGGAALAGIGLLAAVRR